MNNHTNELIYNLKNQFEKKYNNIRIHIFLLNHELFTT